MAALGFEGSERLWGSRPGAEWCALARGEKGAKIVKRAGLYGVATGSAMSEGRLPL